MKESNTNVSVSSTCGRRDEMEDEHIIDTINIPKLNFNCEVLAVFDGHGGSACSKYCKENYVSTLKNEISKSGCPYLSEKFLKDFNKFFDIKLRKAINDNSGTTVTVALVFEDYILLSNCGDSRTLVCKNDSRKNIATEDHKPENKFEKARILKNGGSVVKEKIGPFRYSHRLNGIAAFSRSLGDFRFKKEGSYLLSSIPDIVPTGRNDTKFIVLACDGLWDVFTSSDVDNFLNKYTFKNLQEAADGLVDEALEKGSTDNISIIIRAF